MLRSYHQDSIKANISIIFLYCVKLGIIVSLVMVCAASIYIVPDFIKSIYTVVHERKAFISTADTSE